MKKNSISIKLKITLWYTAVLVIISAVTLFTVISLSSDMLINDVKDNVLRSADNITHIINEPNKSIRKIPKSMFFDKGVHIALYGKDGNIENGIIPFDIDNDAYTVGEIREIEKDGERYITFSKEIVTKTKESITIRAVTSISGESRLLKSVLKTNLILMFVVVAASCVGGYYIIKRSFNPIEKIRQTAEKISEGSDLSQRIAIGVGNDEIYSLANTFDKMLDKIEETLENEKQFTSDVSHELRTPIAVITSECEYAIDCADNFDEVKESVESIKKQSDKMSKLVSELLMLSRMDKNHLRLNFEEVDISELLSFICDEQEEIRDDKISLIRDIKEGVIARADRFLLTRMFVNIISNAYQYGKENGMINVTLREDTDNIIISVSDDGIGISKEDLPKIWERFYQADKSRNNENGSMGLGLSMVKWIAKCHNAEVSVESELGKGSVFTFIMPKQQ